MLYFVVNKYLTIIYRIKITKYKNNFFTVVDADLDENKVDYNENGDSKQLPGVKINETLEASESE